MNAFHIKTSPLLFLIILSISSCKHFVDTPKKDEVLAARKPTNFLFLGLTPQQEKNIIDVYQDLQRLYGNPIYQGRLAIKIVDNDDIDARAINLASKNNRVILVNRFFLNQPNRFRAVMAHEIAHALFQSPLLVKHSNDFLLEGMAMIAEYRVKYPHYSMEKIRGIFHQRVVTESRYYQRIAPEMPFSFVDSKDRRYLYSLAGLLVSSQEPSLISALFSSNPLLFAEIDYEPIKYYIKRSTNLSNLKVLRPPTRIYDSFLE